MFCSVTFHLSFQLLLQIDNNSIRFWNHLGNFLKIIARLPLQKDKPTYMYIVHRHPKGNIYIYIYIPKIKPFSQSTLPHHQHKYKGIVLIIPNKKITQNFYLKQNQRVKEVPVPEGSEKWSCNFLCRTCSYIYSKNKFIGRKKICVKVKMMKRGIEEWTTNLLDWLRFCISVKMSKIPDTWR